MKAWRAVGRRMLPWLTLVLALAWSYRRLLWGWGLAGGDLQLYFFPYWTAAARAFQSGALPWWNSHLFAGAPLLANSQVGFFYPLNWPLWLLSGSDLTGMARTLHLSVLVHLALAALNAAVLARRLGASAWGSALAGLLYAGSGYLGVQVEHLNQLQGLAWLPLALLPVESGPVAPINVLAYTLLLLAGHTQTAFIAAVGAVTFHGALWILQASSHKPQATSGRLFTHYASRITHYVLRLTPFALAGLIAAVQLWPTLELSRLSMRATGLPWREAVSFSLLPWELPRALLPPYLTPLLLPEGVAYLGLVGLALAGWGLWRGWRTRNATGLALTALAGVGLFLALGGYNPLYLAAVRLGAPGLAHFRAPARFLALYVLAGALLAGLALDEVRVRIKARAAALCGLAALELLFCAERLPHADATALRAYTDLRPATAQLLAATRAQLAEGQPPGRFLSISQVRFDPGDKPEIEATYAALSPDALWAYLVAAKNREVLSPNLPLAFEVFAVDGYDGGVLPLQHYATFSRLLLPEGTLDGRLRENLQAIPEGRWLSLLGVQYLITDKTGDAWADGIFYDRQFQPTLAPGEALTLAWLPADFEADALGLLYAGSGEVSVTLSDGTVRAFELPAAAEVGTPTRLPWPPPATPHAITLRAGSTPLTLSGASLLDTRVDAFYPLVLSDRFRLIHSGDVKLYENLAVLPRAFLVQAATCAPDDGAALALLSAPDFDPAAMVVLAECPAPSAELPSSATVGAVEVLLYAAGRVELSVRTDAAAYLVLAEAWYPGWEATLAPVEGGAVAVPVTAPTTRADVLFQATPIPAGNWRVTFAYRPRGWPLPVALSALGMLGLALCAWWQKRANIL